MIYKILAIISALIIIISVLLEIFGIGEYNLTRIFFVFVFASIMAKISELQTQLKEVQSR